MGFLSVLAGVLMAVGPPLAYADQYVSICRKHDSRGFSLDVPGVLIVANVTRAIYWLGDHFQTYLLIQSLLMITTQFGLLYVCLLYRPGDWTEHRPRRIGNLWQWSHFAAYLEFTAILIVGHSAAFLALHRFDAYVQLLGFLALGLEATLPIPQLLANYEAKSTAGFRMTVLAGWAIGDAVKTCVPSSLLFFDLEDLALTLVLAPRSVYFFVTPDNGLQFKLCSVFQLSVDLMLCAQTFLYREQTARDLAERAELAQHRGVAGTEALLHADHERERERGRGGGGETDEEAELETVRK
ncbi:uncharacterized protein RHOBADRAFT_53244 [Rhodotorula graminis WP1]|uniref:PQ-loop-domain-containing protein n=1 Tax=Rhodotorula graminis (strain WP1) TaxID=578459 RepID=A0A194S747_RHOGW|nr:uncharacterized protein RHOBADRAFT_53244 [Rhodotorula graminis WP1]KPV75241.1 hypothetical protein RHOBADRAFT_53244 [Rhodotorula graminis WP1]